MKRKDIKERIKEHFFTFPMDKLRVRQIERKLSLSLPSVIRYTKELESEGILQSFVLGEAKFYTSNRASKEFLRKKMMSNISILWDSGLIDYLIFEYSNPAIILFGSYGKGEDMENSDIDLYVELPKKIKIDIKDFEKKLQRPIQVFQHKSLSEIKNKELANSIINGIRLNGFIEVFNNVGRMYKKRSGSQNNTEQIKGYLPNKYGKRKN